MADVSGEDQKLCFPGQENISNPLAVLPEWKETKHRTMQRKQCPSVNVAYLSANGLQETTLPSLKAKVTDSCF